MTLLKHQHEMYLESSLEYVSVTAYVVLDWLRQITLEASESFAKLYQEIRLFVLAPRPKREFPKRRKELAQLLGSTYQTISECQTGSITTGYPVCAT